MYKQCVLRRAVGLVCVGIAGLMLAVEAFGDRPPDKPPCEGHAPCARTSTVTTTVPSPTTVTGTSTVSTTATVATTTTVARTTTISTTTTNVSTTTKTTTLSSTSTLSFAVQGPPAGPTPGADISVQVATPTGLLFASSDVTYTVVVSNAGPADATGVHLGVLPAGSRVLAGAAGDLGSLAAGASVTAKVTLVPDAAGGMSTIFSAGADQSDPSPGNNVVVVSAAVHTGHAGAPGLLSGQGAFKPPLVAVRSGGGWVVNTKVFVDEPAALVVGVVDKSGKQQTMLPGTLVDYLPANRPHVTIPHVVDAAAWLPLHIKIGGAAGRSYSVVVRAVGPDGSAASTTIGFRTP